MPSRLTVGFFAGVVALHAGVAQAQKNPRGQCGCATSRLLDRGTVDLDTTGSTSAWLHDGATLGAFMKDPEATSSGPPVLRSVEDVFAFDRFVPEGSLLEPGSSALVRVRALSATDVPYLGVTRRQDKTPRDVITVKASRQSAPVVRAPAVTALWLSALEQRERVGCGVWLTARLAFETAPGSAPIEAFVVKNVETHRTAVVDARAVGAFGIGRVDVCEQGLALEAAPATLEIRPVSATLGVGDPWIFDVDGSGETDPQRKLIPIGADESRCKDAFPIPGKDQGHGTTLKETAIVVMGAAVGIAAVAALLLFVVVPLRKRRMQDIACAACGAAVPVDALDPGTDGFFCPACGAAGFWKGRAGAVVHSHAMTPLHNDTKAQ